MYARNCLHIHQNIIYDMYIQSLITISGLTRALPPGRSADEALDQSP